MPAAAPHMDLVLRTSRLELRLPDDRLVAELARLARGGVEAEGQPRMVSGWTMTASPEFELGIVRHAWKLRGSVTPAQWDLSFAVLEDGEVRGVQNLRADSFATRREAASGSWLGVEHHGRGIGTEMRAAVLELAFAHLGAVTARTSWQHDNQASARVSAKLGYSHDGFEIFEDDRGPGWHVCGRVSRATWLEGDARPELVVEGLDAVLPILLGDATAAPPDPAVWPGVGGPS